MGLEETIQGFFQWGQENSVGWEHWVLFLARSVHKDLDVHASESCKDETLVSTKDTPLE